MNLLLNKSSSADSQHQDSTTLKSSGKGNNKQSKASKNLKFAMDLNKEMELMFADDDFRIGKPQKKQKRKENKTLKLPGKSHVLLQKDCLL